jgi:hypothetical protein
MRAVFVALSFFVAGITSAAATTYTYTSNGELTNDSPYCNFFCTTGGSLTGQVTFGFDTSHFTGAYGLGAGDTAFFPGLFEIGPFGSSFYFPSTPVPPDVQGLQDDFGASFVFQNGSIVDWSVTATLTPVGCGLGPGCTYGGSMTLTPGGDQMGGGAYPTFFSYDGSGGFWSNQTPVAPVPEVSAWAMTLIGFAGLGFAAYRRKRIAAA